MNNSTAIQIATLRGEMDDLRRLATVRPREFEPQIARLEKKVETLLGVDLSSEFPPCYYCGKPLTESERDSESGSFYSAHWVSCQNTDPEGRFEAIEATSVFGSSASCRRFSTALRAISEAENLAGSNTAHNGARWEVRDLLTGERIWLTATAPTFVPGSGYVGDPIILEVSPA